MWFEKIRARREQLGLSQSEMARRIGVTQAAVNKIESGRVARSRHLGRIARELGLDPREIDDELKAAYPDQQPDIFVELGFKLLAGRPAVGASDIALASLHERADGLLTPIDLGGTKVSPPPIVLGSIPTYAFKIANMKTMAPEIETGDIIFVQDIPPRADVTCLMFGAEQTPYGNRLGTIRRVVGINEGSYLTRVWHPLKGIERDEVLTKEAWPVCLSLVAKYVGRLTAG